MYKKMISLTAIMAMIVTLVMPARAYADETQAESQPVLKYSVLMSGASEWQEADNGEYVGEPMMMLPPSARIFFKVGRAARIRVSSVMLKFS